MAHHIDADRLRKELQKSKNELKVGNYYLDNSEQAVGYENALNDFELLINSLQQEQPEVDLEKEIKRMVYDVVYDIDGPAIIGTSEYLSVEDIAAIARHFAEWGADHLRDITKMVDIAKEEQK